MRLSLGRPALRYAVNRRRKWASRAKPENREQQRLPAENCHGFAASACGKRKSVTAPVACPFGAGRTKVAMNPGCSWTARISTLPSIVWRRPGPIRTAVSRAAAVCGPLHWAAWGAHWAGIENDRQNRYREREWSPRARIAGPRKVRRWPPARKTSKTAGDGVVQHRGRRHR